MNLGGFCNADQGTCQPGGTIPPTLPTAAQIAASSAAPLATQVLSAVGQYLLGFAARIGKGYVCPYLPSLGGAAGVAVATAFLAQEIPIVVAGGFSVSLAAEEFGRIVGQQAGTDLQKSLCG